VDWVGKMLDLYSVEAEVASVKQKSEANKIKNKAGKR